MNLIAPLFLGILAGFILHRTRFSFYGSCTSFLFHKGSNGLRIFFLTLTITTFGSMIVLWGRPAIAFILPLGLFTIIGGLLVGLGMAFIKGGMITSLWKGLSGSVRSVSGILGALAGMVLYSHAFHKIRPALIDYYAESVILSDFFIPAILIALVFLITTGYLFSRSD